MTEQDEFTGAEFARTDPSFHHVYTNSSVGINTTRREEWCLMMFLFTAHTFNGVMCLGQVGHISAPCDKIVTL